MASQSFDLGYRSAATGAPLESDNLATNGGYERPRSTRHRDE
jgi:hypothetical protein